MLKIMKDFYQKNCFGVLWDSSLVGLALVGLDGSWMEVNPALCELLGYSEHELKNMTFHEVTHPQDIDDDLHMVEKVVQKELDFYTMTKRYITKHGNTVWIKLKVNPVFEDGDPSKKVGFFFSQILPFDVQLVDHENDFTRTPDVTSPFLPFIKNNWKWLLTSIGTVVVGLGGFFWKQDTSITTMRGDITVLQQEVGNINDNLDIIKDLLIK